MSDPLTDAIANAKCVVRGLGVRLCREGGFENTWKHPECAAAAARVVVEQEARRVLATLPRYTHPHDAITALLAALGEVGGDQATGGEHE